MSVTGRARTDISDIEIVSSIACLTNLKTVDFVQFRQLEHVITPRNLKCRFHMRVKSLGVP